MDVDHTFKPFIDNKALFLAGFLLGCVDHKFKPSKKHVNHNFKPSRKQILKTLLSAETRVSKKNVDHKFKQCRS